MLDVIHLNAGNLHAPPFPKVGCHCLLVPMREGLLLVDTGIGLADVADPVSRVGEEAIRLAGFQFVEADTARRQIEALGHPADEVRQIVLTHGDPDHAGGLADFPEAVVHVTIEERRAIEHGSPRYRESQFAHGVKWREATAETETWFGLSARRVSEAGDRRVLLVPLPGHTLGHAGVAIEQGDGRWLFHVGDALYLKGELTTDPHWVTPLAVLRADDDARRRESLRRLQHLVAAANGAVDLVCTHDPGDFPGGVTPEPPGA